MQECIDIFFPKHCQLCKRESKLALCWRCRPDRVRQGWRSLCPHCGSDRRDPCACDIWGSTWPFEKALSLWQYEGLSAEIIREAKYKGNVSLLIELLKLSAQSFPSELSRLPNSETIIVPYPSLAESLRKRGFHASGLIGQWLSQNLRGRKLSFRERRLLRFTKARSQRSSTMSLTERQSQAKKIELLHSVQNQDLLLVDDVITTGASAISAALALRSAGARSVSLFSLARSEQFHSSQQFLASKNQTGKQVRRRTSRSLSSARPPFR